MKKQRVLISNYVPAKLSYLMYKSNTPHIVVIRDDQFKITGMSEIV